MTGSFRPIVLLQTSAFLAFFAVASRALGLLRDRILAARFGASDILDVYYVSFGIPDLIFNLVVAGAISSALVPLFAEYAGQSLERGRDLIRIFLNHTLAVVGVLVVIGAVCAPWAVEIIAPGFAPEHQELAVVFLRVMLLAPLCFTVSMVVGAMLQAQKRFISYALAPLLYNAGIIIGAVWFVPRFGPLGLAEGVVLGALLHACAQLIDAYRSGFVWHAVWNWRDAGLWRVYRLMVPRALGLSVQHIGWLVLNAIATTISIGSVSVLNLAYNIQYLPIAFIGLSVATAYFPDLSHDALVRPRAQVIRQVWRLAIMVGGALCVIVLGMFLLRNMLVALLLGAGMFDGGDITTTSTMLAWFLLGVPAQGVIALLARCFYAFQDTKTPAIVSGIAVVAMVVGGWLCVGVWGPYALAAAFSGASVLQAGLLVLLLHSRVFNTLRAVKE